jgi:hypothetical protein
LTILAASDMSEVVFEPLDGANPHESLLTTSGISCRSPLCLRPAAVSWRPAKASKTASRCSGGLERTQGDVDRFRNVPFAYLTNFAFV